MENSLSSFAFATRRSRGRRTLREFWLSKKPDNFSVGTGESEFGKFNESRPTRGGRSFQERARREFDLKKFHSDAVARDRMTNLAQMNELCRRGTEDLSSLLQRIEIFIGHFDVRKFPEVAIDSVVRPATDREAARALCDERNLCS